MKKTPVYPPGTSPADRVRALRASRAAAGLCITCGQPRDRDDRKVCGTCADRWKDTSLAAYHRGGKERVKVRLAADRLEQITRYGGACVCCGEQAPAFLTFDHANGDGKTHRQEIVGHRAAGRAFVRWLKAHDRLPDIQLLCWNCHLARHYYGACPHRD